MLVMYDYDSNFIHVEPMKSHSKQEHLNAYQRAIQLFKTRGLQPLLQKLDNEASELLQSCMLDENIDFQLVPPGLHRRNAAERAIRTFKKHFMAGLCTTDARFPLTLWDHLLPQALITLNLMRTSRINPRLSAWAQVHGTFDYNRSPLAPPGTRVRLVYENPELRETWAPHAVDGWYLGPALRHYRCYRVWIQETSSERVADTVTWLPTKVKMPSASSTALATAAAQDLVKALQQTTTAAPVSPLNVTQHAALQQLADIFADTTEAPVSPPTTPTVPPGFNPLPPAELPRVVSPSTASPQVPPSVPRGEPPTELAKPTATYAERTGNAGCRRRQRAKARRTATSKTKPSPPPAPANISRSVTRKQRQNGHINITAHVANNITEPLPPQEAPLSAAERNKLPAHAFFTANTVVDPVTGAALEYRHLKLGPDSENGYKA
jgi:hypothetical protein